MLTQQKVPTNSENREYQGNFLMYRHYKYEKQSRDHWISALVENTVSIFVQSPLLIIHWKQWSYKSSGQCPISFIPSSVAWGDCNCGPPTSPSWIFQILGRDTDMESLPCIASSNDVWVFPSMANEKCPLTCSKFSLPGVCALEWLRESSAKTWIWAQDVTRDVVESHPRLNSRPTDQPSSSCRFKLVTSNFSPHGDLWVSQEVLWFDT